VKEAIAKGIVKLLLRWGWGVWVGPDEDLSVSLGPGACEVATDLRLQIVPAPPLRAFEPEDEP
jgi:hypothetical protein